MPPKSWYHVVGVVSRINGYVEIYLDGKLESRVNFTLGAAAMEFGTRTWKIGIAAPDYSDFREAMRGKVDDVRIYSRALSDAEIAALYQEPETESESESEPE